MKDFFENRIIIQTDSELTHEEYNEIADLVKQVLRRKPKHKNRKIRLIEGFLGSEI